MYLYEYQTRQLLQQEATAFVEGFITQNPQEVIKGGAALGSSRCVVKAQIHPRVGNLARAFIASNPMNMAKAIVEANAYYLQVGKRS